MLMLIETQTLTLVKLLRFFPALVMAGHKIKRQFESISSSYMLIFLGILFFFQHLPSTFGDVSQAGGLPWCYGGDPTEKCGGPESWPGICQTGHYQSPINVIDKDIIGSVDEEVKVELSKEYCKPQHGFYVENNGHSIQVSFTEDASMTDKIFIESGPGFPEKYGFLQLHLHWGPSSDRGSEHKINGKGYIMEMHIVHKRYPGSNVNPAGVSSTDKLYNEEEKAELDPEYAVISVFFQDSHGHDNAALEPILEAAIATNNSKPGERKIFKSEPLNLFGLFPENKAAYQYLGSLTTPPCTQSVWWTLFETPVRISRRQIDILLSLNNMEHKHISGNFRQDQPIYSRKVAHRTLKFSERCQESAWKYFQTTATRAEP